MTCVVGYARDGRLWVGADALASGGDGWYVGTRADPKVFSVATRGGPLLVGFTTSWRMGQILETAEEIRALGSPAASVAETVRRWMVTEFVEATRKALKRGGYAEVKDAREAGGEFLVGAYGFLFNVSSDFQVGVPLLMYDAIGAGAWIALGALYALAVTDNDRAGGPAIPPEVRLEIALRAAQEFNGAVRGPFTIFSA